MAEPLANAMQVECAKVDLSRFPNQELRVRVHSAYDTTYLLQSFSQPVNSNIIEFMLLADAVKRMDVDRMVAVIPWFGYSKQDKVFLPGEPLSVKVIAQLIQATPIRKLVTVDLHNISITGYFDIPVTNVSAEKVFAQHFAEVVDSDTIVVSPDAGSVKRSAHFARELGLDLVQIHKQRDLNTGDVSVLGISNSVEGKKIIIFDDMIATGSTMIQVSAYLKERGAASVTVAATHHLYIEGVQDKLDTAPIDAIYVTDSISQPERVHSGKLHVLSIVDLLAQAALGQ